MGWDKIGWDGMGDCIWAQLGAKQAEKCVQGQAIETPLYFVHFVIES